MQSDPARSVSVLGFFFLPSKPGTRSQHVTVTHSVTQPLAVHGFAAGPGVPPAAPIQPDTLPISLEYSATQKPPCCSTTAPVVNSKTLRCRVIQPSPCQC